MSQSFPSTALVCCLFACTAGWPCQAQSELVHLWSASLNGPVANSSPALGPDGTIYIGSDGYEQPAGVFRAVAQLHAYDPNGHRRWSINAHNAAISPPSLGEDGTIYFVAGGPPSQSAELFAVRPNGTRIWRSELVPANAAGLAVGSDGRLYYQSIAAKLVAVNPDGATDWVFEVPDVPLGLSLPYPPGGLALAGDGTVYFGACNGRLYAVDSQGQMLWTASAKEPPDSFVTHTVTTPIVSPDGTIYVASQQAGGLEPDRGHLTAVNPDGSRRWHFGADRVFGAAPALAADGTLYVGCADGRLYALTSEGQLKWTFLTDGPIAGGPGILIDGTVVFGSGDGTLYAVNPDGTQRGAFVADGAIVCSPRVGSEGTIYFGTTARTFYAVSGLAPAAEQGWPMLGRDAQHTAREGTTSPPDPPADLTASRGTFDDKVLLRWNTSNGSVTYEVLRHTHADRTGATVLVSFLAATDSYEDVSAAAQVDYFYWVRARNSAGVGSFAGPVLGSRALPAVGGIRWQFEAAGEVFDSPAVGPDGTVYATSHFSEFVPPFPGIDPQPTNGWLRAFTSTGQLQWACPLPGAAGQSPVVHEDGTVLLGGRDRKFLAIAPDGTVRWEFETETEITTTAALGADGTIYFGAQRLTYALNPDGTLKWSFPNVAPFAAFKPIAAPAVTGGGKVFTGGSQVIQLLRSDGSLAWAMPHGSQMAGGLALDTDGSLALGISGSPHFVHEVGGLWRVESDGSTRWSMSGTNFQATPVLDSTGTVYIGCENDLFLAVNAAGSSHWAFPTAGPVRSAAVLAADGAVYFGAMGGVFYALNSDGSLRWQFDAQGPISSSPVILPDGSVCFGTRTGGLWCLQADAALATAPWPMFQRDARHSGLAPSVLQPPELPTGLRAEAANGCAGVIRVSWNSSPGADHYEVWRGSQDDPDSASALTTHQAVNLVFEDDTATFDTLYYYWVQAVNAAGISEFGPSVSARQATKLWEFSAVRFHAGLALGKDGSVYAGPEVAPIAGQTQAAHFATRLSPDGEILWQVEMPGAVRLSPTVAPNGEVCFVAGTPARYLTMIAPDGAVRWQLETPAPAGQPNQGRVVGPVAIAGDGTIYFILDERILTAVSPDGEILWHSATGRADRDMAQVIAEDGTIIVAASDGLYGYYPNGQLRWLDIGAASRYYPPAIGNDGQVYTARAFDRLLAYQPDGTLLSNWGDVTATQQPVVAADGTVFVAGPRLGLHDRDGTKVWASPTMFAVSFPPCLSADGLAYWFVAESGTGEGSRILALRRDGSTACEYPLTAPLMGPPVLREDGVLLFTTLAGKLQAYRVSAGPEAAPWPMARGDAQGSSNRSGPPMPPPAPQDFAVRPFIGMLRISWHATGQWETNEIWRATSADFTDAVLLDAVPPITILPPWPRPGPYHLTRVNDFFDDNTAEPGKRFFYRVRASNSAGAGPFSPVLSGTLSTGAAKLWAFVAPTDIRWATPTVGFDGTAYVRGFYSDVTAVAPDGTPRWTRDLQDEGRGPVVVGHDGNLYLSTLRGLRVLSPTGDELRTIEPTRAFSTPPAMGWDGTLFVADSPTTFAAYQPDGILKWRRALGGHLGQDPVIAADGSLRLTVDRNLVALEQDGSDRWSQPLTFDILAGGLALTREGMTLYGGNDNQFHGLGPDGSMQFEVPSAEPGFAAAAVGADGTIFFVLAEANAPVSPSGSGVRRRLAAFHPDGSEVWSAPLPTSQAQPPGIALAADGTIYLHSAGNLFAFRAGGELLWAFDTEGAGLVTAPILNVDGRLYFTAGNTLFALQTASAPAAGTWAMPRAHPRGTASLHRPSPPRLRAHLNQAGLRLELEAPSTTGFSLLESTDLVRWRLLTHAHPASGPFLMDIELDAEQARFFRAALP